MLVGALEANRWAGLVFAAGPDDGIGVRLAFTDARGHRRDRDDWYWMVSRAGPHAPDGSYARVEFDLGAEPSPSSTPSASTLILEWSRRGDAVALRATVKAPGRLEVIGDAPWGWAGRWEEVGGDGEGAGGEGWRGRLESGVEIVAAFSEGTMPYRVPGSSRGEVARCLDVEEGMEGSVVMVAAWGGEGVGVESAGLVGRADRWLDEARAEWRLRRPGVAGVPPDLVESITDNLLWMVLLQPGTGRLYTPAGRRWIFPKPAADGRPSDTPGDSLASGADADPGPDDWTVFGWDTFFNALLLATISGDLAWSTLLTGIESRYPNGNVPNWRSRHGGTPDRSQPPIGSFAALGLHHLHPDPAALSSAYHGLLEWCDWWVADKDGRPRREGLTPGLLAWGSDTGLVPGPGRVPPWEEGAGGHQRAAWESGQDDLPLWDEAEWDPQRQILAMSAVDLCSYRALDLDCLSRLARILGDHATARRLERDYRRLATTMNRVLWSASAGLYLDELPSGPSPRVAASNFLPLIAGVPSPRRARRMIETLRDPARFHGEHMLPTIPRDDPAFDDQQYWRGAIWPPMNYLVLQGLRRYGFHDLAHDLAWKGARMLLADRRRTGMCRENFDARTGEGCGQRFQSWAPLLALGALEALGSQGTPSTV